MADRRRAAGFTLLEVLVALAILAVAFGFTFSAVSESVGSLHGARLEQDAIRIGHNLLARLGHDMPVVAGHTSGTEGRTNWTLDVDPESVDPPPTAMLAAHAITLTMSWQDGLQHQLTLRSVRLGPRDSPP